MAEIRQKLILSKQFLIIDSPVPFNLIANNGTDVVYRMAGAWQIDCFKLLPERYQKQYPVFNLELVYDDTNIGSGVVTVRESNIDVGTGITGVNGQLVKITNNDDTPIPIKNYESNGAVVPIDVNCVNLNTIDLSVVAQENTLSSILSYLPQLKKKYKHFNIASLSYLQNNLLNDIYSYFGIDSSYFVPVVNPTISGLSISNLKYLPIPIKELFLIYRNNGETNNKFYAINNCVGLDNGTGFNAFNYLIINTAGNNRIEFTDIMLSGTRRIILDSTKDFCQGFIDFEI